MCKLTKETNFVDETGFICYIKNVRMYILYKIKEWQV